MISPIKDEVEVETFLPAEVISTFGKNGSKNLHNEISFLLSLLILFS